MQHNSQIEKARTFQNRHNPKNPLILTNIWDIGSLKIAEKKGAKAIATASAAVSAANGFQDGEKIPIDIILDLARNLVLSTELPVTVDFESGFAATQEQLAANINKLIEIGVVGCNLEDTDHDEGNMFDTKVAANRIATARTACSRKLNHFFINARIDCFLTPGSKSKVELQEETMERAKAYKKAGASGIFVPLLYDWDFVTKLVKTVKLPINIMGGPKDFDLQRAKAAGVARISYGPYPYRAAMSAFENLVTPLLQE